ncbi:MAG: DNA polymerase I [Firmicutes bacterium]|nr:DNA polymerase I [Bacillota bacterium]
MLRKTFFLVDGHSLLYRAFYALPTMTTNSGEHTNAVYGFTSMLLRLLQEQDPDCLVVAFDKKGPTFRHEQFPDYKANRSETPDELIGQVERVKELVEAFGWSQAELDGYEADDIIGTLCERAKEAGYQVYIVTGDNDCLQLVDDHARVLFTRRGITNVDDMDEEAVKARFGVGPHQVADYKGLVGDPSDNMPGVPGIGPKRAVKLLQKYSSVEEIVANVDKLSGRFAQVMGEHGERALLSKQLATICRDAPVGVDPGHCHLAPPDEERLRDLFAQLEFQTLWRRVEERYGFADAPSSVVASPPAAVALDQVPDVDYLPADGPLVVHFWWEGDPLDARPLALAMGTGTKGFYCRLQEGAWNEVLDKWGPVLADPKRPKVMYNAKAQLLALHSSRCPVRGIISDPMVAGYLLSPGDGRLSLGELCERFGQGSPGAEASETELVGFIGPLAERLEKSLADAGLLKLYQDMEMPLVPVLAGMEASGVAVDREHLEVLSVEMEKELEELTERIYHLAGEPFNINSPKQLGVILFDKLSLPVLKKTKTGPSTSAEVLEELAEENEIAVHLLEYRQLAKLKSTYVDALPALIHPKTGRIHTTFQQTVTATGRLSSIEPNLQNIPVRTPLGRRIRQAFIPGEPKWQLLTADYSQIELRVLAHMSKDEGLTNAFRKGEDIHARAAAEVFGVPMDQVDSELRDRAKAINFGIIYGISSFGLAKGTGLSRTEAQDYIDRYFARYPGVKTYIDETIKEGREKGYVTTLFGRRRYLPELNSKSWARRQFAERMAMNAPIQGTAADIMKLAMIGIHGKMKETQLQARMLLQVHDELVFEVPPHEVDQLARLVREVMENDLHLVVPLVVDIQVGENWRDTAPYRGGM